MERDRRAVATFFVDADLIGGASVSAGDAAAHHARVKRLGVGEPVRVANGRGRIGTGQIAELTRDGLGISIEIIEWVPRPTAIHAHVPVADRDRMLWLAEKATELGLTSWQAVRFVRSASVSPRGEGPAFADRVRARMISALEQSGGAWLPTVLEDTAFPPVSRDTDLRLLLDASGESLATCLEPRGGKAVDVLVGPEGGLEARERDTLIAAGWQPVRLAATTLRFETAGIAAVAALRAMNL